MRRYGIPEPYEKLKELTRGQAVTKDSMQQFIDGLDIPEEVRSKLAKLTPHSYTGLAEDLAKDIEKLVDLESGFKIKWASIKKKDNHLHNFFSWQWRCKNNIVELQKTLICCGLKRLSATLILPGSHLKYFFGTCKMRLMELCQLPSCTLRGNHQAKSAWSIFTNNYLCCSGQS